MNSIIASSLYFSPNQDISFKNIKIACANLYNHILKKQYKNYVANQPKNYDINLAAQHLGFKVEGEPLHKARGDQAVVKLQAKSQISKQLNLAYYANHIGVYFQMESIVAHAGIYLWN